jgi:hypothetical protein
MTLGTSKQRTKSQGSTLRLTQLFFLSVLIINPTALFGYGYSRADDPLIKSFKNAVRAARKDNWGIVSKETNAVKWQLDELKGDLQIDFLPRLKESTEKKDQRLVIIRWVNLVYLGLKQKFYWNLKEDLKDFNKAKARLAAARFYYEVALAGNVRRYDQKRKTQNHKEILGLYDKLRTDLGRPTIFGKSSVAADPKDFALSSKALVDKLDKVFPYFTHTTKTKPRDKGEKKE